MPLVLRTHNRRPHHPHRPVFGGLFDVDPHTWFTTGQPFHGWLEEGPGQAGETRQPVIEVDDGEKQFSVKVEVPDYRPEDIDVTIRGGSLTIELDRHEEREITREGHEWREFSRTSYRRSVPLPPAALSDEVEAEFEDGVLRITVPKSEAAEPKHIEVKQAG